MGKWLCENTPEAGVLFAEASEVLGYHLRTLCSDGPAEKLNETVHSQPALFVTGIAAARAWEKRFPDQAAKVKCAAGLSLGEVTAVCFAGGISFIDGLKVVKARGEAMQACADAVGSGMASVIGLDLPTLQSVCEQARQGDEILIPANLLCPGNIAVSGHREALQRLDEAATQAGAMKVVPLSVAGAFHTSLMQDAVEKLSEALQAVTLQDCRLPVYSNVDARPHTSADEIRDLLARQVVNPVRWEDSVRAMMDDGIGGFMELGTGRVLRGTIKRIARRAPTDGFGDGE